MSRISKKIQDKNLIFSTGIDWIYELFNLGNKINSNYLNTPIKLIGNNKIINKFIKKFADRGIEF